MNQQTTQRQRAHTRLAEVGTAYTPAPNAGEPRPPRRSPETSVGSSLTLEVRRGPDAGQRFVVRSDAPTVLGRHPDCDVPLAHVSVSRRHAEIWPGRDGFVLADMGSLNGSYLNAEPVDTAVLADGDEVAIGVYRLRCHLAGN
jgi:pSer/pThr/pTyr-binding forkhead associated (FHA) protein